MSGSPTLQLLVGYLLSTLVIVLYVSCAYRLTRTTAYPKALLVIGVLVTSSGVAAMSYSNGWVRDAATQFVLMGGLGVIAVVTAVKRRQGQW